MQVAVYPKHVGKGLTLLSRGKLAATNTPTNCSGSFMETIFTVLRLTLKQDNIN